MYQRHDPRRFSLMYTPPTWFRRELRKLSPKLRVSWNGIVNCWEISEKVQKVVNFDDNKWHINAVVLPFYEKVLYTPGLGSKVLDWIHRNRVDRYKNLTELDLDTVVKNYL